MLDVLMSRLAIPVTGMTLWSTGDVRLWVELTLQLQDNAGGWTGLAYGKLDQPDHSTCLRDLSKSQQN